MAYDRIEPFGDPRADLRAAQTTAAVVNFSYAPPKTPAKPIDFMPFAKKRRAAEFKPVLLVDKEAQSKLIKQIIFGVKE